MTAHRSTAAPEQPTSLLGGPSTSAEGEPVLGTAVPTPRRNTRRTPERVPALAHLSLPALRSYRRQLASEEGRVSYWRRILQARADVLARSEDAPVPVERLGEVLNEARSSRLVLLDVGIPDDLPPLPDLAGLWTLIDPQDNDAREALVARLSHADAVLSSYRSALHRRQDLATRELIARYHEEPSSCLIALPSR